MQVRRPIELCNLCSVVSAVRILLDSEVIATIKTSAAMSGEKSGISIFVTHPGMSAMLIQTRLVYCVWRAPVCLGANGIARQIEFWLIAIVMAPSGRPVLLEGGRNTAATGVVISLISLSDSLEVCH